MNDDILQSTAGDDSWHPTAHLRWEEYEWYDSKEERHLDRVLQQKWVNIKTGVEVWDNIDVVKKYYETPLSLD